MLTIEHDTKPWDPAEALGSEVAQLAYLALTLEEDDPSGFTEALGVVAPARPGQAINRPKTRIITDC